MWIFIRIILRYFFLFFHENICCNPLLELSRGDSSYDDGSHDMYMHVWSFMSNLLYLLSQFLLI